MSFEQADRIVRVKAESVRSQLMAMGVNLLDGIQAHTAANSTDILFAMSAVHGRLTLQLVIRLHEQYPDANDRWRIVGEIVPDLSLEIIDIETSGGAGLSYCLQSASWIYATSGADDPAIEQLLLRFQPDGCISSVEESEAYRCVALAAHVFLAGVDGRLMLS